MNTGPLLTLLFFGLVIALIVLAAVYVVIPTGRGLLWMIRRIFEFVFVQIAEILRLIGAVLIAFLLIMPVCLNTIIGRWQRANKQSKLIGRELRLAAFHIVRLIVGNPARFLGFQTFIHNFDARLRSGLHVDDDALAIPHIEIDLPTHSNHLEQRAHTQFSGYQIIGTLPGGGSGAKLYIAEPTVQKQKELIQDNANTDSPPQASFNKVVIKNFSIHDGSSLAQIIRESQSLPAAQRLGLVLEHHLGEHHFFYVMKHVPGDNLSIITPRLHRESSLGQAGLDDEKLRNVLTFAVDLLRSLQKYHTAGLFHKDVKPDNIIIADNRAHLVDFGLLTPITSSMTLTTHGTEYFRDPEMVRQALRGVKVHQVDGTRFDIYAVGAVLYSMLENSFPAHGSLSQITKHCPESVRWIVRRAMADYDQRYADAQQMLEDLCAVINAPASDALLPAALPSVRSQIDALSKNLNGSSTTPSSIST